MANERGTGVKRLRNPMNGNTRPGSGKRSSEADNSNPGPVTIGDWIIELTDKAPEGRWINPTDVAKAFRPVREDERAGAEKWRTYLRQVRSEAIGLARAGHIHIVRKGQPIDPSKPFKGVYRLLKA